MASVRDIQIAEALVTLCLAYYVMKRVREIETVWLSRAFTHRDMGRAFHEYRKRRKFGEFGESRKFAKL